MKRKSNDGPASARGINFARAGRAALGAVGVFSLASGWVSPAWGAPSLTVTPSSPGNYLLTADDLKDMARMEIVIRYDPSTLAHPRVDRATGIPRIVQSADTADSGVVTIKASRSPAFTGSGSVAYLHFDRTGPSPGTVDSMDGVVYNSQGVPESAQVSITNPPPDQSGNGREGETPARSGGVEKGAGSAALPGGAREKAQPTAYEGTVGGTAVTVSEGEGKQGTVPPAGMRPPVAGAPRPSVLDRFLGYSGTRTIGALAALFDAGRNDREMRQEPSVALSDGTAELLMTVFVEPADTPGLKFVLNGLHFLSLQRSDDRHWQIRALPHKGSSRASLVVVTDRSVAEFPVTIAPPLEVGPEACAADAEVLTVPEVAIDSPSDILSSAEAGEGGMAAAYVHTANCLARGLVTPLRASVPTGSR